jgi:hypothetical protein
MRASAGFFARFGSKGALVPLASLAVAVLTGCSGVGPAEEPVGAARQEACFASGWDVFTTTADDFFGDDLYPTTECGWAIVEVDNISVFFNVVAQWNGSTPTTQAACEARNVFLKDYVLVSGTWTTHNTGVTGFGTWNGFSCAVPFAEDNSITNGDSYLFYTDAASCQYNGGPCSVNNNCCSGSCTSGVCAHGSLFPDADEALEVYTN